MTYSMLHGLGDCTPKLHCGCLAPSVTDGARADEGRSEYTVQQTAAHFARRVQRVTDRIHSADYQPSVVDVVALDNVQGFLDRIARNDLDVYAAGRAETTTAGVAWDPGAEADYRAGRWCGQCRYGVVEDPPCCTQPAETTTATTATTEDMTTRLAAAEAELDRLCVGGRFIMSIPAREGYDSDLLIQAALSDLRGLLASSSPARTRPTREQIIEAIGHDGEWCKPERGPERCCDAPKIADAVLALLADQPTEAEAGARAVSEMGDWFMRQGFDRDVTAAQACYERAARIRGGAR